MPRNPSTPSVVDAYAAGSNNCGPQDFQDPVPAVLVIKDSHGNRVDLLGGIRGLEAAAFSRTITVPFQGKSLRVIGLEDLIAMKVFAGAPKDLNDAGAAIQVAGDALDLDLRRLAKGYGR
jgi:hypothetical protein